MRPAGVSCARNCALLNLALILKVDEEITDHGCNEHCEVNKCDPGLIIDVEFLECEASRMRYKYPANEVDHDADSCPESACYS